MKPVGEQVWDRVEESAWRRASDQVSGRVKGRVLVSVQSPVDIVAEVAARAKAGITLNERG